MKIIHLISGGDTGGAKTHVLSLLCELNKTIHADLVCFMEGPFAQEARELGIPVTVFEGHFQSSVNKVKKMISEGKYDIIHCHGSRANLVGALIKNSVGLPVVSTVHSDYRLDYMGRPGAAATYGKMNAWALRKLDYRVCVSDQMRQTLIERGFEPNRLYSIYNGIDFSREVKKTDRKKYFEDIGCPFENDDIIAGIAARLDPVKDIGTLIRGFAKAHEKYPKLKLLIAGDGIDNERLHGLAKELNVSESVFFAGWVTDMDSFYGVLDINTLTSLSETFPYAITEGARVHLPTISSAVGGVPKLVKHGQTGMLFKPGDVDGLADALSKMADSEELRHKLGEAIFVKGSNEFSTEVTCRTQLDIYENVLKREHALKSGEKYGVVICGAYGHGNAGDEAILEAIVGEMRALDKYMPITVISRNPEETQKIRGVNSIHRLNYPAFTAAMSNAKLYINGGGSLIQDVTSRRSLEFYLYTIKTAKRVGCKIIMYGCGIGPVIYPEDIEKARAIINDNVDIITLREPNSLEELKRFGIDKPEIILSSDPAINLPASEDWEVDAFLRDENIEPNGKYIGIALRQWNGFDSKAQVIAESIDYVYDKYGLTPVFVSINRIDDVKAAEKVASYFENTPYYIIKSYANSSMVSGVMSRMTTVVSMRLHGLIFAAGQGTSIVGISYDPKVASFIDYIGQGPCMDIDNVTKEGLIKAIEDAIARNTDKQDRTNAVEKLQQIEKQNMQAAQKLLEM